jgi:hypothetical protein
VKINKIEFCGKQYINNRQKSIEMAEIVKSKIAIIKANLAECKTLKDEIRVITTEKKPATRAKPDERKKNFMLSKKDHYKKVLYEESGGISVTANAITKRMNEVWTKMTEDEKNKFHNNEKSETEDEKQEVEEEDEDFPVGIN